MERPHPPVRALLVLFAAAAGLPPGCADEEARRVRALVPGVDPVLLGHLVSSDDSTLARYARDLHPLVLRDALYELRAAIDLDSEEGYRASLRLLADPVLRLSRCGDRAGGHLLAEESRFLLDLSWEDAREIRSLVRERKRVQQDPALGPGEKLGRFRCILQAFRELGYDQGVLMTMGAIARQLDSLGRAADALEAYREVLREAQAQGHALLTCTYLGVVGHLHETGGEIDSMRACWDRGMSLADSLGIAPESARFRVFYANHYRDRGRLTLAEEFLGDALEKIRAGGDISHEFRVTYQTMQFYASLDCWEVVEDLIPRGRVILRSIPAAVSRETRLLYRTRLDRMEARLLRATGQADGAETILERIEDEVRGLVDRTDYADLLLERGRVLLDLGRTREALSLLQEGEHYAHAAFLPERSARFRLLLAKSCSLLGRPEEALGHLEEFASSAAPGGLRAEEWATHDAVRIGVALARGRPARARAHLAAALERAVRSARATDATGTGYLRLAGMDELFDAGRQVVEDDPAASYGLEMMRRRLRCELGSDDRDGGSAASAAGQGIPDPARIRERLAERDAVHVMYRVGPDGIVRWVATGEGIRSETLPAGIGELGDVVRRAVDRLSEDPGDSREGPSPPLVRVLRELGDRLLPPEAWSDPGSPSRPLLLVSPDDVLELLPFEALGSRRHGEYRPLGLDADVAYVRFFRDRPEEPADHPGLVLADPEHTLEHRRRYPELGSLRFPAEEARALQSLAPDVRLLAGKNATKARILELWEEASFLHVATHIVRDPQRPFFTFVPVSEPDQPSGPEESHIEIEDVRGADLRRCRLVVLSGCSSGAPYVGVESSAPSLGDAFLDSGARAVIHARWAVRDDFARETMDAFHSLWIGEKRCPIRALAEVRRAAMRRDGRVLHPSHWAAFSIKLGDLAPLAD